MQCIYCLKTEDVVSFESVEHVIPNMFGKYTNSCQTPTLVKSVCDKCNKDFSKLETIFKEDSLEGIISQMLNLNNERSVRIRGNKTIVSTKFGFGNGFYNEYFPFVKPVLGSQPQLIFVPQIKVKNYLNGFQVFQIDALRKIRKSTDFEKYKRRLRTLKKSDIAIFLPGDPQCQISNIIELLRDFEIIYDEHHREYIPSSKMTKQELIELGFQGKIDTEILRLVAKISLNYFSYCSIYSKLPTLPYNKSFNSAKDFIIGKNTDFASKIQINNESFHLLNDKASNSRTLAIIITLELIKENVVCKLSILGTPNMYIIQLGRIPDYLISDVFGCGHIFDPIQHTINNLGPIKSKLFSKNKPQYNLYSKPF